MKTSRSGAGGAFPSYDDFSEEKEVEQKSPAASADYDAAELAEANAMLVKMLRASKAAAEKQSPTVEEIAPPAK